MSRPSHEAIDVDTLKSFRVFEKRIDEIEQIFKAEDAIATLDYMNGNIKKLRELSPDDLIREIATYSRSSPGRQRDFSSLNEAAIVLLSAYLEGFIEELHEEITFHLLQERVESVGILKALLEYAHGRFSNPKSQSNY